VTRRIGERAALMSGLLFAGVGFLIFALAPTGAIFWLAIPVMALSGLEVPACMSLMSRLVGGSEQGRLQGANASVIGIANLLGPGLFTLTFAFAIGSGRNFNLPGAPFLIAALLIALAAWLATRP
jgi:MFS transporter, DHA1 family, tetracycline resistance protein